MKRISQRCAIMWMSLRPRSFTQKRRWLRNDWTSIPFMTVRVRLSLSLFLAGFIGILSGLFIDVAALAQALPLTAGAPLPMPIWAIKLLSLVQPAVIVAAAVLIGGSLASKVSLSAPAFEAWA